MTAPKIKAAAYVRTSREFKEIDGVSISEQITHAKEKAVEKNLDLPEARIFIDENRSGTYPPEQWGDLAPVSGKTNKPTKQRRQGFTQLVASIEKGEIKVVICRKRNRISRNFEVRRRFAKLLTKHNVTLYCTKEYEDKEHDITSELSGDMLALLDEYIVKQGREDILQAKEYSKNEGRKMGWVQSVGYEDDGPQKVKPVPQEEDLVTKIFKKFVNEQLSLNRIVLWLDDYYPAKKIKSGKKRTRWYVQTVKNMLTNPAYIGMARNSKDGLIDSKAYTAIVPVLLWTQAQDRLEATRNAKHGSRYAEHTLGGLMRCYCCGEKLNIHREVNTLADGAEVAYYNMICSTKTATCPKNKKAAYFRESELELWLESFITHACPATEHEQDNPETAMLYVKKGELKKRLDELFSRIDIPLDSSLAREKAFKTEIGKIEQQIAQQQGKQILYVKKWDDMDTTEQRQRIRDLVNDIRISRNYLFIRYKQSLKYSSEYYNHIDGVDIDNPQAPPPDTAFPIMKKLVNGRWRNALLPDDPLEVQIDYTDLTLDGVNYLMPDWKESQRKNGEDVICESFRYRNNNH
jgi:DNA invertase Pin-like site-specific DNA recombinase